MIFSIPQPFLRHILSLGLLSRCAIGLELVSICGFERFIVFQFEVDFSFDQFLEIIFDGRQLCFHVLEKNFATRLVFDIAGRCRSPINFIGDEEWFLIERVPLLGKSIDVGIGPFDFEFFHRLILKFIKIFIILTYYTNLLHFHTEDKQNMQISNHHTTSFCSSAISYLRI